MEYHVDVGNRSGKVYQKDVANRFSALERLEISNVDDTWVTIINIKGKPGKVKL